MKKVFACAQVLLLASVVSLAFAADVNKSGSHKKSKRTDCTNCATREKKCINNECVTGIKVYTGSTPSGSGYKCTYHYEWPDGSYSPDYSENHPYPCALI